MKNRYLIIADSSKLGFKMIGKKLSDIKSGA